MLALALERRVPFQERAAGAIARTDRWALQGKSTALTGKKAKGAAKDYDEHDLEFQKKQREEAKAKKELADKLKAGKR